ncbi:NADH:flavin oxidoreductase [Bacillus benzoevorans]|uniref:2,4-dienoyl-CoA reductase-like NADH-dependent reductase (Old Yellow Enzyme family) n=1 Tax=Bacillus benzoevorans TaxID=1456 RepID=A0A7X0HSI3_9BACI|nr:NADH:flavin oxidoreductase [Bacillus benzoevorans]MBB6446070.1 2,4-dienoyl-CoA reductase-like NADH-dependent reductase (Old Yellow Enzyme family) [Bacillus benzoevorans]
MKLQDSEIKVNKNAVLLESRKIKNFVFQNRYACAPFDITKASKNGLITEELLSIYKQRTGPSLIVAEQAAISPAGQYRENLIFVDRDECIEGLSKLAEVIHSNNQIAVLQINHAGSSADTSLTGIEAVAPSAVMNPVVKRSIPRALTIPEIQQMREAFVQAALRVKNAGFDGVEIHNCHGFLLTQFLSPLTNTRTDEYGGSLENRSRLLLEIVGDVRKAVGEDFLLLVRLGVDDLLPGGTTLEEGCIIAEKLEEAGIDILDISTGLMPPMSLPGPAMLRSRLREVKRHVKIPVIGAGELEDIEIAADMVGKGEVDFIALGRTIMNQPNYVEGLLEKISLA